MPPSRMLTRNTPPPTSAPSPPRRHPLRTSSRCLLPFRTTPPPTFALRTAPRHPLPLPSTTPHSIPLPTSSRLHHHAACFCPAPPAPALPEGPKMPPAGPGTGSHRPNTHNRPIARTRTKKERHPLPDAAPWNGCAASTRGRRPYRPLRAGRRTRPAYWPQSTPR